MNGREMESVEGKWSVCGNGESFKRISKNATLKRRMLD